MPIEDNRKPIGIFENKRHKNVNRKAEQRMVNYISDHTGKQPTRKGLKTAVGMLYAFSLFQNFKLEEEMPNKQRAVQEDRAIFEMDTFVVTDEWINHKDEVVHSLSSSSTFDARTIHGVSNNNRTQSEFAPQINTSTLLVEAAQLWSLAVHKFVHGIVELDDCTTTKTETIGRKAGLWEQPKNVQTHFKTMCKVATAKSQKINEQETEPSHAPQQFYFKKIPPTNDRDYFEAKDIAEKLKNVFEGFVDETPSINPTKKNGTDNTNDPYFHGMTDDFWFYLADSFRSFIRNPLKPSAERPEEGTSRQFYKWLKDTFDGIPKTREPFGREQKKNPLEHPFSTHNLPPLNLPSSKEESEQLLTTIWQLTSRFTESISGFFDQKTNFFGVDARSLPSHSMTPTPISEQIPKIEFTSYEDIPEKTVDKINRIIDTYLKRQPFPEVDLEPMMPFWYDYDVFQQRFKTDEVNEAVKDFMGDLALHDLFVLISNWEQDTFAFHLILEKRISLAHLILKKYGIPDRELTYREAVAIALQWRTNNIFKGFEFTEVSSVIIHLTLPKVKVNNLTTTISPIAYLAQVHNIKEILENNEMPAGILFQDLPIFYYEYDLFINRDKTDKVKELLLEFFKKNKVEIQGEATSKKIMGGLKKFVESGGSSYPLAQELREQFITYIIMKAYGVENIRLGDPYLLTKTSAVQQQLKVNLLMKGCTYKENTEQTDHLRLSSPETPYTTRLQEQKKVSEKIFHDFIHDQAATISNVDPIKPYCYDYPILLQRAKTLNVNKAIRVFLIAKGLSLGDVPNSELVRKLQSWLLNGENYEDTVQRQKDVAELLLKHYGIEGRLLTVQDVRVCILQWEDNNAQLNYLIDEKLESELKDKKVEIDTFLQENNLQKKAEDTQSVEATSYVEETLIQKEETKRRVADFLVEQGQSWNMSDPSAFAHAVTHWVLLEGATIEMIDPVKIKQLAQVILNEKIDGVISGVQAKLTYIKWLFETFNLDDQTHELPVNINMTDNKQTEQHGLPVNNDMTDNKQTEQTERKPIDSSVSKERWRNKNIGVQLNQFFMQHGVVPFDQSTERILISMGKWLTQEGVGMVFMPDKIQPIAKIILNELKMQGDASEDKISVKKAETTIMKWAIENILNGSVEEYIIRKIIDSPDPSSFTIGQIRNLLEVDSLRKEGVITLHTIVGKDSREEEMLRKDQVVFEKLWIKFIEKVLPNYFLESSQLADDLLISDFDSLMQLAGGKLLADAGYLSEFSREDVIRLGTFFCDYLEIQSIQQIEGLQYLITPALLATAQLDSEGLREALENGEYKVYALQTFITFWQEMTESIVENEKIFYYEMSVYEEAVINWRRKKALAEYVNQECNKRSGKNRLLLDQAYLLGLPACPDVYQPPNLEEWYTQLTKNVAEAFFKVNQRFISTALNGLDQSEKNFLFSNDTRIYKASAELKHQEHYYVPPGIGGIPVVNFSEREKWLDTDLNLEKTDLFAAIHGTEERLYAVKRLEQNGGYIFYRVDKDPLLYLKYGLFDQKDLWRKGYIQNGEKIRIGKKDFTFSTKINRENELGQGMNQATLSTAISQIQRDRFYHQLYEFGNDKSVPEQIWDVIKHIIPFYDCIVGVIEKNVSDAVTSCTIDVIFLIPIFGQVVGLSTNFALGMAKAAAESGVRHAIRSGMRFTPNRLELKALLKSTARYADPGFELVTDGAKLILKGFSELKNQRFIPAHLKPLITKSETLIGKIPPLPEDYVRAQLPRKGPYSVVRRVKDSLYMQVMNLKDGDIFGGYFTLHGNQLRPFEGNLFYDQEEIKRINRLANQVDTSQMFVVEKNLNPKGYGEGKVYYVKKNGEVIGSFVRMNQQMVPVQLHSIEGHGLRYDVYEGNNLFPIRFNGVGWFFETESSPRLAKEVTDYVASQPEQFESLSSPISLTPPDEFGLMYASSGRSYIKANNRYVPLVLIDQENQRYHLVKKKVTKPLIILRFDEIHNHFRMETQLERINADPHHAILAGRKKNVPKKPTKKAAGDKKVKQPISQIIAAGTTRDADRLAEIAKTLEYPPYYKLPESLGVAETFDQFRKATTLSEHPKKFRYEDDRVKLPTLTSFVSEFTNPTARTDQMAKSCMKHEIARILANDPEIPYRIFPGFTSDEVPEYIDEFQKEVASGVDEAVTYLQAFKQKAEELLKFETLAEREPGQYLNHMFKLETSENKEQVMKEVIKRLLIIADKSKQFLNLSKDLGYQNIWIVSSDLVYDKKTKNYYTSKVKPPTTVAFVVNADPECRILIMADKFHIKSSTKPTTQTTPTLFGTVIHETTHIVSSTVDYAKFEDPPKGFQSSGEDIRKRYDYEYEKITYSENFDLFVRHLAQEFNLPKLARSEVVKQLWVDPMLAANFLILDAEVVMTIIRDLALDNNFFNRLRVKRESKDEPLIDPKIFMFFALMHTENFFLLEKEYETEKNQTKVGNIIEDQPPTLPSTPSIRDKRSFATIVQQAATNSKETNKTVNISFSNLNKKELSVREFN